MDQSDANKHTDQQEGEFLTPSPEEDNCKIQETSPIIDESNQEGDAPKLVPQPSRQLIGSNKVWQIDHTEMDLLLSPEFKSAN